MEEETEEKTDEEFIKEEIEKENQKIYAISKKEAKFKQQILKAILK